MLKRMLCVAAAAALVLASQPTWAMAEEEEEAPESAVSSPPMEMDDPGTPGRQGIEINIVGSHLRIGDGRSTETLLDANYGIGDRIQLKYERPYVSEGAVGTKPQRGMGATEFGIKWRAIEHNGLELAVYPQYTLDDAFTIKDENGDPEPSEGRSFYVPLLVSCEVHHIYTVAANVGFGHSLDGHGDDVSLALGGGRAVGDGRVLAEVFSHRDKDLNNLETDVRVGYATLLFPKMTEHSSFEMPIYASYGHSVGRTDVQARAASFTFGVSYIRKPKA
ncbi:MAG TPA: hypothetical protein VJY35_01910 [Candidatus Eisenbacteria bacterium]|nr:hypothetical protein [Candidatus Eisenbacteria bacterium]